MRGEKGGQADGLASDAKVGGGAEVEEGYWITLTMTSAGRRSHRAEAHRDGAGKRGGWREKEPETLVMSKRVEAVDGRDADEQSR